MKKIIMLFVLFLIISWGTTFAADQQDAHTGMDMKNPMDTGMKMDNSGSMDTFRHHETVDGIRAEFQVMSLASMNMKDPEGNTHHIMVKFMHDSMNHQINNVAGKIKIISPSGKEQVADLKDYSGVYAGNFTFDEKGKYGVICLFKEGENKHVVKFWYESMMDM